MKLRFKDLADELVEVEGDFIREDVEEGFVYLEVNGQEECYEINKVLSFEEV